MKKLFFVALLSSLAIGSAYAGNPDLNEEIGTSTGGYAYVGNSGGVGGNGVNGVDTPEDAGINDSDRNAFGIKYGNNKIITGHGRCSTRAGTTFNWDTNTYNNVPENFVETLTNQTGQEGAVYCYCKLETYISSGNLSQSLSGPWVLTNDWSDSTSSECADSCAGDCANILSYNDPSYYLSYRTAVFNAYAPPFNGISSVTTQTYVDNKLATKQAKITTTGTNKLMTYGASTGATPGSRDIVSTLGTSTTATTVPETGPIVAGIANKQDAVNGTANYIMTGTGTAGTVGEKPVYSSTNNYSNALVEAQTVNTAAANAANSELSCIDNDCLLWQINTSGPAGISTRIYIGDPAIAGTGVCCRGFGGQSFNDKSGCTGTANSYMGSVGNKSGRWGVTFPYGDVMGISVCSTDYSNPYTRGYVADNAKGEALNLAYEQQKGNDTIVGGTCWCKMQAPAVSSWVIGMMYGSSNNGPSNCRGVCANACALTIKDNNSNVRTIMYNTLQ